MAGILGQYLLSHLLDIGPMAEARKKQEREDEALRQMAAMAPQIYGKAGIPEIVEHQYQQMEGPLLPGQDRPAIGVDQITQTGVQGTGMYDTSKSVPDRLMGVVQNMIQSKNPLYKDLAVDLTKNMFDKQIEGHNQLTKIAEQAKIDAAKPATLSNPGKMARDAGHLPGTPGFKKFVDDYAKKSGTTVNLNTAAQYRAGTPEENVKWGYPADTPTHWSEGKLHRNVKMDQTQSKNLAYHQAMLESEENLDILTEEFPNFNPANITDSVLRSMQSEGGTIGSIVGKFQSPESKQYLTNAMNWVAANRAYVSGAAVPEIEVQRDLQTYFAQPGDNPELLELKKQLRLNRKNALAQTIGMTETQRARTLRKSANDDYRKMVKKRKNNPEPEAFGGSSNVVPDAYGLPPGYTWE